MSRVDQLYRKLLLTKFFTKGWGKPDNLKRIFDFRKIMSDREQCRLLVPNDYPIHIDKEYADGDVRLVEGHFLSPLTTHLPGIMPKEVQKATFQMVLPKQWQNSKHKPMCIQLAGTGDHFFWRRRLLMAKPLLKEAGIASILLENPYYGSRKPKGQLRSSLHNVSDLFVMGGALILESLALLHWCQRQGYGPLGLTGISMGGHMASLAATNWHEPISLVPCLSWSTASVVFTQGVMSGAIPWKTLETQFFENSVYQDEISKLIVSPEWNGDEAYKMGQQFVKDFSSNYGRLQEMHQHYLHTKDQHEHTLHQQQQQATHNNPPLADTSQTSARASIDYHNEGVGADSTVDSRHTEEASRLLIQVSVGGGLPQPLPSPSPSSSPHSSHSHSSSSSSSLTMSRETSLSLKHALSKSQLLRSSPPPSSSSSSSLYTRDPSSSSSSSFSLTPPLSQSQSSRSLQKEAVNFMVGVMDECTHLGNFSVPVDPRLIIIIAAQNDAYYPRDGVIPLNKLWPGSEVRYLNNRGHIAAFLLHNNVFRKAIIDSFDRQMQLHGKS